MHQPSPLAEGRELKFNGRMVEAEKNMSPLAEGRELKFVWGSIS